MSVCEPPFPVGRCLSRLSHYLHLPQSTGHQLVPSSRSETSTDKVTSQVSGYCLQQGSPSSSSDKSVEFHSVDCRSFWPCRQWGPTQFHQILAIMRSIMSPCSILYSANKIQKTSAVNFETQILFKLSTEDIIRALIKHVVNLFMASINMKTESFNKFYYWSVSFHSWKWSFKFYRKWSPRQSCHPGYLSVIFLSVVRTCKYPLIVTRINDGTQGNLGFGRNYWDTFVENIEILRLEFDTEIIHYWPLQSCFCSTEKGLKITTRE